MDTSDNSGNSLNDFTVVGTSERDVGNILKGVVKWFNQSGKYGVIKSLDSTEYFVYITHTKDKLYDGIEVTFKKSIDSSKKNRLIAVDVCQDTDSSVNRDILHKINKIDMCFSFVNSNITQKPNSNEVKLVSNLKLDMVIKDDILNLVNTIHPTIVTKKGIKIYTVSINNIPCSSNLKIFIERLSFLNPSTGLLESDSETVENIQIWDIQQNSNRYVIHIKNKESLILHMMGGTKEIVFKHKYSFIKNSIIMKNKNTIICGESVATDWIVQ